MARVEVQAEGIADIQLLKDEEGGLMMEEGISTISFYKGEFKAAAAALSSQLAVVVASNPWLCGRLVKTKAGVRLRHPASPSAAEVSALFKATSADDTAGFKLTPDSDYVKICTDMYASKKVIVGSGYSLVDKDQSVTILTLAESAPGDFALIFSMSHAIADGRTYYEILRMLQPGADVRGLVTSRVMSFSEDMRDVCGRKELAWSDKPSTQIGYTLAMMFGNAVKCFAFHLDSDKLSAAKSAAAASGGVPYVSTNDILTSGFFNVCKARIGMMGMDCRERLKGIDKDLAGNYVTALVMDRVTFESPSTIRKMLSSTPYQTVGEPLPGCCGLVCGKKDSAKFAMATNWSSFAGGLVQLEGCEMELHLPVLNTAYVTFDCMIPFASGAGRMGVICWTVSTDEDGLRKALPVGELVSTVLFPDSTAKE